MSDHNADTSREAVERLADDLQMIRWPADQGCIMREDAARTLRALLSRAERAEAERDAHWQIIERLTAGATKLQAERDAARAEAERMREALNSVALELGGSGQTHASLVRALNIAVAALAAKEPGLLVEGTRDNAVKNPREPGATRHE